MKALVHSVRTLISLLMRPLLTGASRFCLSKSKERKRSLCAGVRAISSFYLVSSASTYDVAVGASALRNPR